MPDEMPNNEAPRWTRRNLLKAVGAGVLLGVGGGLVVPIPDNRPRNVSKASPSPSSQPTEKPTDTPTEKPTPTPSPELKVGELPDTLSSTDKDWDKYFVKETDISKINEMIKQQQTDENALAQKENRESRIICLFIFDPFETMKLGDWTVRKIHNGTGLGYGFLLPSETQLKAPFEGIFIQRGFASGRKSLDLKSTIHGYEFWSEYFGTVEFNMGKALAGQPYLKTTKDTQTYSNAGAIDLKGSTSIFGSVQKDASSPLSYIKWLVNDRGQILYTQ